MKKIFLLLGILSAVSLSAHAEDEITAHEMQMGHPEAKAVAETLEPVADEGENAAVIAEGMKQSDSSAWGVNPSAKAVIAGTVPDSTVKGTADFVETGGGVQVVVSLTGVTPAGKHGFHVHEKGSCEDTGNAAGGHFNPASSPHGLLPRDGHDKAHSGDMGNIEIDDKGTGTLMLFMPGLSLTQGDANIAGKAVILHEKEDDFGQPTGNAGGRIGCGIITLNN